MASGIAASSSPFGSSAQDRWNPPRATVDCRATVAQGDDEGLAIVTCDGQALDAIELHPILEHRPARWPKNTKARWFVSAQSGRATRHSRPPDGGAYPSCRSQIPAA